MTASAEQFAASRPRLLGLAYRILGSIQDAEDVLQDCWLRWQTRAPVDLNDPQAWLMKTVTNLCLDQLKSARMRRECYVGPWLPEPLLSDEQCSTEKLVELSDSLSYAYVAMLQQLSAKERVVFILREAFDYSHQEIAATIGCQQADSRQTLRRARQRLNPERATNQRNDHRQALQTFASASVNGDLDALLQILTDDVQLISDGGGKVLAALRPLRGLQRIERFFLRLMSQLSEQHRFSVRAINGREGLWVTEGDKPYACVTIACHDGKVSTIYVIRNPDKLSIPQVNPLH